ncbi:hypothetical protein ACQ7B2_24865, partial [Escherichia coli]
VVGGLKRLPVLAAAGAVAAAAAGWALLVEPRRLVVRRPELHVSPWSQDLDGLRVAILSDLHAGGPHVDATRVADVAERLAREQPDLALL